jgi:hypothetical protein
LSTNVHSNQKLLHLPHFAKRRYGI